MDKHRVLYIVFICFASLTICVSFAANAHATWGQICDPASTATETHGTLDGREECVVGYDAENSGCAAIYARYCSSLCYLGEAYVESGAFTTLAPDEYIAGWKNTISYGKWRQVYCGYCGSPIPGTALYESTYPDCSFRAPCLASQNECRYIKKTRRCRVDVHLHSSANIDTGNLHESFDIFSGKGVGPSTEITFSYDSLDDVAGPLGKGWTHSFNSFILSGSPHALTLFEGDGTATSLFRGNTAEVFTASTVPGNYTTIATIMDTDTGLLKNYEVQEKDGMVRTYDASGNLLSVTDRNGNSVTLSYTASGLANITDSVGRTTFFTYDQYGRITAITNPAGRSARMTYDTNGYLSTITDPAGNVRSFTYSPNGMMLTKTDAHGNVTSYAYDKSGRVISASDASGTQTVTYDTDSAYVTGKDGKTTFYQYDPAVLAITAVIASDDTTTARTYDANGNLLSQTDALGNTTSYNYDAEGNMLTFTDAGGKTTSYTYNQWGQVTTVTDASGNVTNLSYDDRGNLVSTTDPLGNTTTMTYNRRGLLLSSTDAEGNVTYYTYDPYGNLSSVIDPLDHVTSYTYTVDDDIATVTDAKNHTIEYDYDSLGRVVMMSDQLGNREAYIYDQYGNIVTDTDRKGQTTTYTYDQMNRIASVTYADGSSTSYAYDTMGRLTTIADSVSGAISYEYSTTSCGSGCSSGSVNRVTKETTPMGSISYTYDALGRRTSMTVAGEPAVYYSYDADGRMTGVDTQINGAAASFGVGYDSMGRRTSLSFPNGVTTDYAYDKAGRVLTIEDVGPLQTELESISYAYDPAGNRINVNRADTSELLPDTVSGSSFNQANQMFSFGDKNMTYDANGNMTSFSNGCGTTTYTWDARNRLVAINGFRPDCTALTASFVYDALGRRIEKTINGLTIGYLYDGQDIVQEMENGRPSVIYIRTLDIDNPLARLNLQMHTVRYYHADALGSIMGLSDESGREVTQYAYDPFGNVTIYGEIYENPGTGHHPADHGPPPNPHGGRRQGNPVQYTGRENDGTGLYYYRARYYSPELQRFISEDPIGFKGRSINLYSYASNNPLNRSDPLGLWSPEPPGAAKIFLPPACLPCGQMPDEYCAAEHQKRVAACRELGCPQREYQWWTQCELWVVKVQQGDLPWPPHCK